MQQSVTQPIVMTGKRLEIVRKRLEVNKSELARRIGSPQSHISKVLNGHEVIGKHLGEQIIRQLRLNPEWWESGEGEMFDSQQHEAKEPVVDYSTSTTRLIGLHDPDTYRAVPIVRYRVWATFVDNFGDFNFDKIDDTYPVYMPDLDGPVTERHMVFEVLGDSMEPTIRERSKVLAELVDDGNVEYLNSGVYVIAYRNKLVIKRIVDNTLLFNGTLTLVSDNPKHGITPIRREDIRYVWRVTDIVGSKVR